MESPAFLKHKIQPDSGFPPSHFLGTGYYLQKAEECLISLILASLQRKESAKSSGGVEEEGGKIKVVLIFFFFFKKAISASLYSLDTLRPVLASQRQIMLNPSFENLKKKA